MKLGLQLNGFDFAGVPARLGATLAEIGEAADAAGFDRIGVTDHVWQSDWLGGPEHNQLECYTTLGFLAAHTRRARLTAMVTAAPYRPAGLLAKIVTTLDVLSGGRAGLGIGAGDDEAEARGLGLPYPPLAERYELLEETLQVCLRMWADDRQPFAGRHERLARPLNRPQSLSRPHPPIMVAGDGERKTLRLVARYADACNLRPGPQIPHKLEVLRRHCAAEDRDYGAIEKTCPFRFDVGPDGAKVPELIGQLRWLAGLGIQTVIGVVPDVARIAPLEIIGRAVIPVVAEL